MRPLVIKKERAKALSLLQADFDEGGSPSIIFDETTDCCDRHPVNITPTTDYNHKEGVAGPWD